VAEESLLTDDFLHELMSVGEVDLLVGVPTYNDAATIGPIVQAIRAGLVQHFPRQRAVIINADGGSHDMTQELVRAASINDLQHHPNPHALRTLHSISVRYNGGPSSGRGLYAILAAADLLHSSACAVISADSTNIEPEWIAHLLQPVCQEGFDLVTPVYHRHKFDGLLVRNLVYPMVRAVYGKQIREPYPSEFAFSGRLATHLFGQEGWAVEAEQDGAKLYLTIAAITGSFKLAQALLGSKTRAQNTPPADVVDALREGVGPLFSSMDQQPAWRSSAASEPVPILGGQPEVSLEPLRINRKRLYDLFRSGVSELVPLLSSILGQFTLQQLQELASRGEQDFCYCDELWVKTVYEFAASYHRAVLNRDHIIQALAPLYRGRAYTFLVENRDSQSEEVERNVEALCLTFEKFKPYLGELWDGRK
jgi:glucosylglycerate synthase